MLKQRHQLFVTLLTAADGLAVAAASGASWATRVWAYGEAWPSGASGWVRGPLVLVTIPVTLACLLASGLYRPHRDKTLWHEQGRVLRATLVALAAAVVAVWALGGPGPLGPAELRTLGGWTLPADPARFQLAALAAMLPAAVGSQRLAFRLALRSLRRRGKNLRHVAIVGTGRLGQIACRTITRNSWTGLHPNYFVTHHGEALRERCLGLPVRGSMEELDSVLDEHPVDAVYLALPAAQAAAVPGLLRVLERHAVDVRIVPDVPPRYLPQSMTVGELEGMPILSYRECPVRGLGGFTKRVLDVSGALTGLIVFGPVMLACAAAVRLSGPGPVLFRQERVSLGGQRFRILKFRTMRHAEDEAGAAGWTERRDERVTRVGRWLRRTSLDELPQLLNVLGGEMSLVGPRPERPELVARFRDDWRGYMIRQQVKAGMTGWAQVHGLRGDTSLRKRVQYDLFYIRHWSVWLDLRILWKTVFRGFVHPNAH